MESMKYVELKIQEFENRPRALSDSEERRRVDQLEHMSAINRFEGIVPGAIDKRLFRLLATGRVSTREYLDLCLADARDAA